MNFKNIFALLRPKQWVKNLLVFAAIIFSRHLSDFTMLFKVCVTFVIFCGLSSATYILNDLLDLKEDRAHPWKKKRPLASGAVSKQTAVMINLGLLAVCLGVAFALDSKLGLVFVCYYFIQCAYSFFGLKHVVLLDVMLIAVGFVMRAIAGGVVIHVVITNWLLLCTFLLAIFLALLKRRQELIVMEEDQAVSHRQVLLEYSVNFIDSLISIVAGATIVSYALYTVSPEVQSKFGTDHLVFTLPFVLYGVFRYLYLVHQKDLGDNPTRVLFTDLALQLDILAWLVTCFLMIYFHV